MDDVAAAKRAAAEQAAELVQDGMAVGLGTGSTVAHLVPALAARGLRSIRCVATSPQTERQARELGLRVESFDALDRFDIAIDGADQVAPDGWLVKGGGGAHVREKIVAQAAARFVVIVDAAKLVEALHPPVPLELMPYGLQATLHLLSDLGKVSLRDAPRSPDGGLIADLEADVGDPGALAARLDAIAGVTGHGLFAPAAVQDVIVGADRTGAGGGVAALSSPARMSSPSGDLLAVARALATDHVTLMLDRELRIAGVRPILIKGASIVAWLYADGTARPYADADILVDPDCITTAENVLRRNGFQTSEEKWGGDYELHARAWGRRSDGASVDLHRTLPGLREVSPVRAWKVLDRHRERLPLGGGEVDQLDVPARLLLVALHLTHHTLHYPADVSKPLEDLRRALAQVDEQDWRAALDLAGDLDAVARFTAGLRQGEGGDELADRIGAPPAILLDVLRPGSATPLALGFDRLLGARTLRERVRIIRAELLPPPDYVRFTSLRARSGPAGLAEEYARRIGRAARYAGPSYVAWRRARRR